MLHDDTHGDVEYLFGDRIAELTQDADGVDVIFASGDRRRFELVIGADGLHSALRAMVFGPREQFVRHLGLVLAFYSVPNVPSPRPASTSTTATSRHRSGCSASRWPASAG